MHHSETDQPSLRRRVIGMFTTVLLLTLAALLVILLLLWWQQERMVWLPPRLVEYPDGAPATRVDYTAEDGQPLFAYVVGVPATSRGMLVIFHGNADLAAWTVPWAQEIAQRTGWAVLVPEYRGYAGLPGTPTYLGSQRDARAAYAVARAQLGGSSTRIAFYGYSLGSAVATELARESPPSVLILEAPFTSARDMASRMVTLPVATLWRAFARVHFDTRRGVAALDVPVWVVHGERDRAIPSWMGRAVHGAAKRPGRLLVVENAGHADVADNAGRAYWDWLRAALETPGASDASDAPGERG